MRKDNKKPKKKEENKDVLDEIIEEINALDDNSPAEGGQPEEAASEDLEFDYGFLEKKKPEKPEKQGKSDKSKGDAAGEESVRRRDRIPYENSGQPEGTDRESGEQPVQPAEGQPVPGGVQQFVQGPQFAGQQPYPGQPYRNPYGAPVRNGATGPRKKKKHKKKQRSRLPGRTSFSRSTGSKRTAIPGMDSAAVIIRGSI